MYNGLLHLHNLLRWVILLLLVIAIVKAFVGMSGNKPLSNGDKKVSLFLMIFSHIQLLIGLYQWLAGRYGILKNAVPEGVSVMKDKFFRFYMIEHPVGMLIAIILITIGRGQVKKSISDATKHKKMFWFYMIALIIILATVPWPFREIVARPLFPGMQ